MKIGVTLGCIVAALLFVIAAVTKFNSLENRLENVEEKKPPAEEKERAPNEAEPVLFTTPEGKQVAVEPTAVQVTAKELACLKLIDDYTRTGVDYRGTVKQQLKDMRCFEEAIDQNARATQNGRADTKRP